MSISFAKVGDACNVFRGKHMIGGIVFYNRTYIVNFRENTTLHFMWMVAEDFIEMPSQIFFWKIN